MTRGGIRLALAGLRETALAVATWVGVGVVLTFWVLFLPWNTARAMLGPNASPEQVESVRESLGTARPFHERFLDTLVGILTFDGGVSLAVAPGEPVAGVVWSHAWASASLLFVSLVVAAGLGAVVLGVTWVLRRTPASPLAAGPAYLASAVPPFAWVVVLFVLSFAGAPGPTVWSGGPDAFADPVGALPAALALAIPAVGVAARRLSLAGDRPAVPVPRIPGDDGHPGRSAEAAYALRALSLESWILSSYLVGATVAVEAAFAYPGLGHLGLDALLNRDLPVFLFAVSVVAALFVLLGIARNLAWSAGEVFGDAPSLLAKGGDGASARDDDAVGGSADASEDGGPAGDPDSGTRTDGGVMTGNPDGGTRTDGGVVTGDPDGGDPVAARPSALTVLASGRRFQVGIAAFAVLFLVGTVGSLTLSPPGPLATGFSAARTVNALGTTVVVPVVAGAISLPLGVGLGTLWGRYGRPVGTLLNWPLEVVLAFPLLVSGSLVVLYGQSGGMGRTTFELAAGVAVGVAVLPLVVRATAMEVDALLSTVEGDRPGISRTVTEVLPVALGPVLGRAGGYLAFGVFLTAEAGFLGFGPRSLIQFGRVARYAQSPERLPELLVPVVLPTIAVLLAADGLRTAARPETT